MMKLLMCICGAVSCVTVCA